MENNTINKTERTTWVDVTKFVAIIGVMIDHTNDLLYTSKYVAWFSYYNVSLFILIMGVTTMWSYRRNSDQLLKKAGMKCLGIIRPYIVATIVYGLFLYRAFDIEVILEHLIRFNMSGPFYYVLLYIQLALISPVLYSVFEYADNSKKGILIEVMGFAVVLIISCFTTASSNILNVFGGGGKLFGGTYLVLLYMGMWFAKYSDRICINSIISGFLTLLTFALTITWWRFISDDNCQIDTLLPFGDGDNPPSISLCLYALLIATTIYFLELFLLRFSDGIAMKIMKVLAGLGKHTLYIFLYHRFFIDIVFPKVFAATGIVLGNIWLKRFLYFGVMIFGSILLERVLEFLHKRVLLAYKIK